MPSQGIGQRAGRAAMPRRPLAAAGFTLVELVAVMVVTGLLAAIAMPRFFQRSTFDARNFSEQSRAMLRYAQKVAIAQNRAVFVQFGGAGVALCFSAPTGAASGCAAANRVRPPSGANSGAAATASHCGGDTQWHCEGVPAGLRYTLSQPYAYFYFSALGRPYAPADAVGALASSFATLVATVSGEDDNFPTTVEAETGYVH